MKNRYIGTRFTVNAALDEIKELRSLGYRETQMTVVAQTDDDLAQLNKQTAVSIEGKEDETLLRRFKGLFMDHKHKKESIFEELGFSKVEAENIYQEMKDNGIALFVEDVTPGPESNKQATNHLIESDSSAAMTNSGEVLSNEEGSDKNKPVMDTMPPLDTTNL